jgi:peptidyl-prolyl cis-trans isomerase A (cyclophilin A)
MKRLLQWGVWSGVLGVALACQAEPPEPQFKKPRKPAAETQPAAGSAGQKPVSAAPAEALPKRLVKQPSSPDPLAGKFELSAATAGLEGKGALSALIRTGEGDLRCKLFDDKAPLTVANFVGLARGLRPYWDARDAAWVKRPLFDGTTFHRTIADFMIQGGDHLGDGTGEVGYNLPDELAPGMSHDRAGLLCMANRGPNTNGGQFFITDAATPHLTQMRTYTIFGECAPVEVVHKIARGARKNAFSERPENPVVIKKVTITRG